MTNWPRAGWRAFLSNRYLLYELCERCAVWGGTPTSVTGLDRVFSDWICFTIDNGLAIWRLWYTARAKEMIRGKRSARPKYTTLDDVLGITVAREAGWMPGQEATTDTSEAYKSAVLEALRAGQPMPDITAWMDDRHWQDDDDDEIANDDAEWQ